MSDFFGRPPCKGVHPDEAVALGAAIFGAAVARGQADALLADVTSHSLGMMVSGGRFHSLIRRNTRLPTSVGKSFTTTRDEQTSIDVVIVQGENEDATRNHHLGRFELRGLQSLPRGAVDVEVTFAMSTDGIVSVTARDRQTGLEQVARVVSLAALSDEEINKLAETSDRHAVAQRIEEERSGKQQVIEKMAGEAEKLFPRVLRAMARTTMDWDQIRNARNLIDRARSGVVFDDAGLDVTEKQLIETIERFKILGG